MTSRATDEDDRSLGVRILARVPERVVLAIISILGLLAVVLNDFIDSWFAVGLTIGVATVIAVLVAVPPSRLRGAFTRTKQSSTLTSTSHGRIRYVQPAVVGEVGRPQRGATGVDQSEGGEANHTTD